MNITLQKKTVLKRVRMVTPCPNCKTNMTLDLDVFTEDPKFIFCYKCTSKFQVLTINKEKINKMELQINKVNNE